MENIAYYNGKIASIEEMMIPMNERSSYFGDGVYDAMFTIDHVPLQLDEHLRRFYRSAKRIESDIPMPFDARRGHARACVPLRGRHAEPVGIRQA